MEKEYRKIRILGQGATSDVYCVREEKSQRLYACKESNQIPFLKAESEMLRCLNHPLFPAWVSYREEAQKGYLIMEYVEGENLAQILKRRKFFSVRESARILLEVADGLICLEEKFPGRIYRDLKPVNLMIQPDGKVRLVDLGAAAIPPGWMAGTPGYAAPEQLEKGKVPGRSADVYALAKVMQEMLGKQKKIPASLKVLLERCLSEKPGERIPDMRKMRRYLTCFTRSGALRYPVQRLQFYFQIKSKKMTYEENVLKKTAERQRKSSKKTEEKQRKDKEKAAGEKYAE
mgnify:CR=1 FL=1